MKTNSKIVREQIRQHVIDRVTGPEGETYNTFEESANRVKEEFDGAANYPYNLQRFPNHQERFSDWLCGLPFGFEFYHSGIKDFLNGLGINPEGKEYSNDKSLKLYHYLIFREVFN